jgi:hypothetical protein
MSVADRELNEYFRIYNTTSFRNQTGLDGLKESMRKQFLVETGSDEEEFERCWPRLRHEFFRQRVVNALNSRKNLL